MKKKIKVEGGEMVERPNKVAEMINAGSHSSGKDKTMEVEPGTVVFSKQLKGPDGKSMAERKQEREKRAKKRNRTLKSFEKKLETFGKHDVATNNMINKKLEYLMDGAVRDEMEEMDDIIQMEVANAMDGKDETIPEYNLGGLVGLAANLAIGNIPGAVMSGVNLASGALNKSGSGNTLQSSPGAGAGAAGGFDISSLIGPALTLLGGGVPSFKNGGVVGKIPSYATGGTVNGDDDWWIRKIMEYKQQGAPATGQGDEVGVPPANIPPTLQAMTGQRNANPPATGQGDEVGVPPANIPPTLQAMTGQRTTTGQVDPVQMKGLELIPGLNNVIGGLTAGTMTGNRSDFPQVSQKPDLVGDPTADQYYDPAKDADVTPYVVANMDQFGELDSATMSPTGARFKTGSEGTNGLASGPLGTAISAASPMIATILNRLGDRKHGNQFRDFADRALRLNEQQLGQAAATRERQLERSDVAKATNRQRGRMSARSQQLMRALDAATATDAFRREQQIEDKFRQDEGRILAKRGEIMTAQDRAIAQENIRTRTAEDEDRDAFYTALSTSGQEIGRGLQQGAKMSAFTDPNSYEGIMQQLLQLTNNVAALGVAPKKTD